MLGQCKGKLEVPWWAYTFCIFPGKFLDIEPKLSYAGKSAGDDIFLKALLYQQAKKSHTWFSVGNS